MSCVSFKFSDGTSGILSLGGPDRLIEIDGAIFIFEDHPYFGPAFVNKRTRDPLRNQPGPRHPVWRAVDRWYAQGKLIDPVNRFCMWSDEAKDIVKHIGGRHYMHVGTEPQLPPASRHPVIKGRA